jgi:hypothetical protein
MLPSHLAELVKASKAIDVPEIPGMTWRQAIPLCYRWEPKRAGPDQDYVGEGTDRTVWALKN